MKNDSISSWILIIPLFLIENYSCKLENSIPELSEFAIRNETDWDHKVIAKDGSSYFCYQNDFNPTPLFYKPDSKVEGYPLLFNSKGSPILAVTQGQLFFFGNYKINPVDVYVGLPEGFKKAFRNIEFPYKRENLYLKSVSIEISDWINWVGTSINGVFCAIRLVGTLSTGGLSITLSTIGCGSIVIAFVTDFLIENFEIYGISTDAIAGIAETVDFYVPECKAIECILSLAEFSLTLLGHGIEIIEDTKEYTELVESIANSESDDVKITLSWISTTYLDLHVIDPKGNEILWKKKEPSSFGFLDFEDQDGGEVKENVFWEKGTAPVGLQQDYGHNNNWHQQWRFYICI